MRLHHQLQGKLFIRSYFVVLAQDVHLNNGFWCRLLHTINTYLMLSTYCWMLCEAVFLIMILVKTLLEEESLLMQLSLFGWGAPILILIPYVTYRLEHEDEDTNCWMQNGDSDIFLYVPVLVIIILNLILLGIVLKIIKTSTTFQQLHRQRGSAISDTRSQSGLEAPRLAAARQSSRAVLMLTPVFGLHFLLLPVIPGPDSAWEKVHAIISALSTSSQGLVVSLILCFANKEVVAKVKGYLRRKFSRDHHSMEINNRNLPRVETHGQSIVTSFTRTSSIN